MRNFNGFVTLILNNHLSEYIVKQQKVTWDSFVKYGPIALTH
jgi:hypothetical protein